MERIKNIALWAKEALEWKLEQVNQDTLADCPNSETSIQQVPAKYPYNEEQQASARDAGAATPESDAVLEIGSQVETSSTYDNPKPRVEQAIMILATSRKGLLGLNNQMPWPYLQTDSLVFRELTLGGCVIMGRKTWQSFKEKRKGANNITNSPHKEPLGLHQVDHNKTNRFFPCPIVNDPTQKLANRVNIIVTRQPLCSLSRDCPYCSGTDRNIRVVSTLDDALYWGQKVVCKSTFIIGGAQLYKLAESHPTVTKILWTQLLAEPSSFSLKDKNSSSDLQETTTSSNDPRVVYYNIPMDLFTLQQTGPIIVDEAIPYQFLCYHKKTFGPIKPSSSSCSTTSTSSISSSISSSIPSSIPSSISSSISSTSPLSISVPALHHINKEEMQYLDMIDRIILLGDFRPDRTGEGTLFLSGETARYSLRGGKIPLLTTKRVYWKSVASELLWFIRGKMDLRLLHKMGVHIWDDNVADFANKRNARLSTSMVEDAKDARGRGPLPTSSREDQHEQSCASAIVSSDSTVPSKDNWPAYECGPIYGFQWRHFGAAWRGCDADYTNQGVDQLKDVIETIRTQPSSRRMLISGWNPVDMKNMVLPPCHVSYQFLVNSHNELSCVLYQRSGDCGLGVPFNIASASLLTHMIAHITDKQPGELIHVIADAHVYCNHVEPLKEQLKRIPTAFPTLIFKRKVTSIDDFAIEDFEIKNYAPQGPIKMKMAV